MEKEFYITKEQFVALKEAWKSKASHSASEMIIYNLLRSKPIDNGFCPKTKNIQGGNEWYAFNNATRTAKRFCEPRRVRVDNPNGLVNILTGHIHRMWVDDLESTQAEFKEKYNIDMPSDIIFKFEGALK